LSRLFAIDFAARRWRVTGAAWLLLALMAIVAATWVTVAADLRRRLAQAGSELAALQRTQARATAAQERSVRTGAITPERARSVNDAIRRLNLPWDAIFSALNTAASSQVALLSLEPDAAAGVVRLTGETRTTESMLALQRRLGQQSGITSAVITKHEVKVGSPGAPVRFWIEARWETAR
jgi:Tfp pilus assembly protein PilN